MNEQRPTTEADVPDPRDRLTQNQARRAFAADRDARLLALPASPSDVACRACELAPGVLDGTARVHRGHIFPIVRRGAGR